MPARIAIAALALLLAVTPARGHGLAPSLLEIAARADGTASVLWKTPPTRPRGANPTPVLPARCRALGAPTTGETGEGITRAWEVDCGPAGLVGGEIAVSDLDVARTDALVHVEWADGRVVQTVLRADRPSFVVPERPSRLEVFRDYLALGLEHILGGHDHLLFVLGLLLLVRDPRSLAATITAFTIGHSLTLSAAMLGLADLRPALAEFLIAASVLTLAVEVAHDDGDSLLRRRPWLAAGGFGLLHGLGFAGALREAGLPEGSIPQALVAFNIGIEVGQLLFVAALGAAWLALRRAVGRGDRAKRLALVPAYAIGSIAAFWCFERAALLLR
jgi:hydrogenase/urease accessory protein HupE